MASPLLFCPRRPLVPLTVAFACGILLGASVLIVALALAALLIALLGWRTRNPRLVATAILVGFACAGALRQAASLLVAHDDVSHYTGGLIVTLHGTVVSDQDVRPQTISLVASVDSVETADGVHACSGLIACTLARGDGRLPDYGDGLECRGAIEQPEPAGNPGGFDEREYLQHRGIFAVLRVHRPSGWSVRAGADAPALPQSVASRLRVSLRNTAGRYLGGPEASLLSGIMVGSRAELPRSVSDDFQLTGTSHILATAGLHVGLVALLLHGGLRLFGTSRRTSAAVTMIALLLYAMVAGGRPSVVRAVLVTDLFLAGYLLGREVDAWNSLALAALVLLAYRPGSLFDVGFQLSFATVGSIIAIMSLVQPYVREWLSNRGIPTRGRVRVVRKAAAFMVNVLVLTTAAQIGSAPLTAEYFNLLSPSGLLANLLIVPTLMPILALGFLLWLTGAVGVPVIPEVSAWALRPLLTFVIGAARSCSEMPMAAVSVSSPGSALIAFYYAGLAGIVRAAGRRLPPARVEFVDDVAPALEPAK